VTEEPHCDWNLYLICLEKFGSRGVNFGLTTCLINLLFELSSRPVNCMKERTLIASASAVRLDMPILHLERLVHALAACFSFVAVNVNFLNVGLIRNCVFGLES
jgi:hypothetical protein